MMGLAAVLLAIGGMAAYFALVTRFPLWRRVPWEFLAVSGAGGLLGLAGFARSPGIGSAVAAGASAAAFGFALWYVFRYSMFGAREEAPRVGDPFPDFALPDSTGGTFRLSDARGRRLFLLFYRGDW